MRRKAAEPAGARQRRGGEAVGRDARDTRTAEGLQAVTMSVLAKTLFGY